MEYPHQSASGAPSPQDPPRRSRRAPKQDAAAISRTARVVDALEQAERIEQLISDAIAVELSE